MKLGFLHQTIFIALLLCHFSFCPAGEKLDPKDPNRYLNAVREFADNVLKYGRDTYGPKHTPLFVDGLNIHSHEPVKWIDPDGTRWILSNFASQQKLLRTLDGLTVLTGDPKYRQAAMDAIRYEFDHVRTPSGLFYWGRITAYDALGDIVRGSNESVRCHYPYYDLMWKVDPNATKKLIEAFWSVHILDWSNLDMNRIGLINEAIEEPWYHDYDTESPTFFEGKGLGFFPTGTSLIHAGVTLYKLSGQEQPLVWSKRLAKRYVDTRHPNTGISYEAYNTRWPELGEDLKEHFVNPRTTYFPAPSFSLDINSISTRKPIFCFPWMSMLLTGEMIGNEGKELIKWALEELTAWGKASYRRKDNSFIPILTDGTKLEGYVWRGIPDLRELAIKPLRADTQIFWAYSMAYRITDDQFMWQMARDIGIGNDLGDLGETPADTPELKMNTACSDVSALLGFLELYAKTSKPAYLKMAQRIGDNVLLRQFHKGFFVPSGKHIYTRFDCFEPLALLHLHAAAGTKMGGMPQVWPSYPMFVPAYRHKQEGIDRQVIYALTESAEPPLSLQEAADIGDIDLVRSILDKGVGVDSWDGSLKKTALQHAAIRGHKEVVALLLDEGARIDSQEDFPGGTALDYAAEKSHTEIVQLLISRGANINTKRKYYPAGDTPLHTAVKSGRKEIVEMLANGGADINPRNDRGDAPLHIAVQNGQRDIVELLINKGADINIKNNRGQTPLDIAMRQGRKPIVRTLLANGVEVSSIFVAAFIGDLTKVKGFLEEGVDVNAKDTRKRTALQYAAEEGHKQIVELLLENGAEVNAGNRTAAEMAMKNNHNDIVKLLMSKGTDISPLHFAISMKDEVKARSLIESGASLNQKTQYGTTPLRIAVGTGQKNIAKLLIEKGADVNTKNRWGWTPLFGAVYRDKEMVELLLTKGANVNVKDGNGRTPLWYAKQQGHTEIVELLKKYGAKE